MIHYGLQYQRLVMLAADEVVNAKLELVKQVRELEEINKKQVKAINGVEVAKIGFNGRQEFLTALLYSEPVDAVEEYFKLNGKYPISVSVSKYVWEEVKKDIGL